MKTRAGIDRYIAKAGGFAQPILTRLRAIVHAACPKAEEAMKWRAPHTRQRRLETAIEWMAQGKSRHWNYAKC
jgi:hypothetical protein